MLARFVLVVLLIGTFGCSSATYIRATVTGNPLDRVAQQAQEDWSVERVDANTLHISDAWPIHSVGALGYSASHANLSYDAPGSVLNIQYYFQSDQLPDALYSPHHQCRARPCRRGAQTDHEWADQ